LCEISDAIIFSSYPVGYMIEFNTTTMPALLMQHRIHENCFNPGEIMTAIAVVIIVIIVVAIMVIQD